MDYPVDLVIAAMDSGERAMLHNIISRGLASLPKTQRTDGAVAAAERMQRVLTDTPDLGNTRTLVLNALFAAPRGRVLAGINAAFLHHFADEGLLTRRADDRWHITRDAARTHYARGHADDIVAAAAQPPMRDIRAQLRAEGRELMGLTDAAIRELYADTRTAVQA
jgi:hypothetical protein